VDKATGAIGGDLRWPLFMSITFVLSVANIVYNLEANVADYAVKTGRYPIKGA
jgi:hypothetical protein